MGGDKNKMEPTSCHKWEKNKDLWMEITNGGLLPYLKKLHGQDLRIIDEFVNG